MKKLVVSFLLLTVLSQLTACKSEKKRELQKKIVKEKVIYSLFKANNQVNWTAYKTTEKKPVKGSFKTVKILKNGVGNTVKEAINNAEFSIPVSSIFSGNEERDGKLIKFFFNVMDNTSLLKGILVLDSDTTGTANITMNEVTKKLPFTYTISGKEFKLEATLDLKKWKVEKAISSLNKVCFDLHKGADGVSKTWNEVAISIYSTFE